MVKRETLIQQLKICKFYVWLTEALIGQIIEIYILGQIRL